MFQLITANEKLRRPTTVDTGLSSYSESSATGAPCLSLQRGSRPSSPRRGAELLRPRAFPSLAESTERDHYLKPNAETRCCDIALRDTTIPGQNCPVAHEGTQVSVPVPHGGM